MNVTYHLSKLSKSIVIEKYVIAIESTIMSQLVRYTSLFLLILVSVQSHSFGQCPDRGFTNGKFSITGAAGALASITVDGDGNAQTTASNNSALRICEGESIVLAKTSPTIGTVGGVHYWLINEALYNAATYTFPSNLITSFANYDPSSGATNTQVILNAANLPDASSPSPYKYTGPGRYLLIQKDQSYSGGTPDNYYACQVIEIVSPTITKPNFTAASCIDGSVVVSLPTDAARNIFYNYKVTYKNTATGNVESTANSSNNPTYEYKFPASPLASTSSKNIEVAVTGQTQTGGCANATTTQTITVKSASKPKAGLITGQATNGSYDVEFIAEAGVKREVFIREIPSSYNFSSTSFANFVSGTPNTSGYESKTYTVPNPNKQYCFIARAVDNSTLCPIGNAVTADVEACTTTLKITAGDKKNQLTWSPFVTGMLGGVFQSYEIYREGTAFPIKKITVAGTTSYDDDDASLVCGTTYKYTVKTIYGSQSNSSPVEVEFKQTTKSDSYDRIYTTVSEDNSTVTLIPSNASGSKPPIDAVINIYRKEFNSGTYSKYVVASQDKLNGVFFSDFKDEQVETTKKQYCYYVTWELGLCGESKPSAEVCTILLKKTGENLTWTPENPMSVPIGQYNVTNAKDPNSGFIAPGDFALTSSTNFSLLSIPESRGQEFWIRIEVGNANGTKNPVSYSNYIHYERPLAILLPQIFTPDGNAINETFDIQGKHIRKTKMWIYDRWGSPIFYKEAENKEDVTTGLWIDTGWDGTLSNGQKAPQGNYVYKVEIEDSVGKVSIKTGSFILTY